MTQSSEEGMAHLIYYIRVCCNNEKDILKFIIYYRYSTITGIKAKNDQSPPCNDLQKTNLVFEFSCIEDVCEHLRSMYIGVT